MPWLPTLEAEIECMNELLLKKSNRVLTQRESRVRSSSHVLDSVDVHVSLGLIILIEEPDERLLFYDSYRSVLLQPFILTPPMLLETSFNVVRATHVVLTVLE